MATGLSKKQRFRERFDSEHVKEIQILAKYSWEHFNHVFSSFSEILIQKISPLVLVEILGEFVNTLTVDHKYPFGDCKNLPLLIQMQLSEKRKNFSHFFSHFLSLDQILNILKEKIFVVANVFPKLLTVKNSVRRLFKKRRFRRRF